MTNTAFDLYILCLHKIRIKYYKVQQCILIIEALHVSPSDGPHRKTPNTSVETLRVCYKHVLSFKG
jgi:hypothetical protein